MTNYTQWKSLVDLQEYPAIPDYVAYRLDSRSPSGFDDGDEITSWECDVINESVSGTATYRTGGVGDNPYINFDGSTDGFDNTSDFANLSEPMGYITIVDHPDQEQGIITGASNQIAARDSDRFWTRQTDTAGDFINVPPSFNEPTVYGARQKEGDNRLIKNDEEEVATREGSVDDFEALGVGYDHVNDRRYYEGRLYLLEVHNEGLSDTELLDRVIEVANEFGISFD